MAPIRVITGDRGKTERLLDAAVERYRLDPLARVLVLVPTVRHGDQIRRRLVARCGAAFGLEVATVAQWARGAVEARVPPRGVLAALLQRVTDEAIADGRAAAFASLAGTGGLRSLIEAAVADLLADEVAPADLRAAATRDARLLALAAVAEAFAAATAERGWLHPAALAAAAAQQLEAGEAEALPPLVLVDGFRVFRRGELRLLAACAGHAEVLLAFDATSDRARSDLDALRALVPCAMEAAAPAPAPEPARFAASAPDREAMLRAVAREVKQLLADDPALRPSDCAIAVRQVGPYLALARHVFREYDLPLDPAAGVRLAERPLGVWLRRLLHIDAEGWRLRDLVAVLGSALLDGMRWGLAPRHVAALARLGRTKHLWAGAEAMDALVEALLVTAFNDGTDEDGERPLPEALRDRHREAADGLRLALADLRALLAPAPAPLRDHARALDAALFGSQPLVAAALRETDGAGVEMDALRGCLRAVASADEALAGPPVPFATFVARLERELDAPAVLLREPGGVLLAPLHTLHGLRFAYLAVAGLVEGEFPARRATSALLDREARGHLAAHGLVLPPEPRASEDELWATACTRADGVLSLWRPRLDERGRPAPPSYYFPDDLPARAAPGAASRRETAIEASAGWLAGRAERPAVVEAWPTVRAAVPVEQRRRSFLGAGTFEGDLPPTALPALTAPEVPWSATRFEAYRTCGFQFFARYALHLRELDEERDGVDPATRGTVIHEILQATLEPLHAAGRPLSGETLPDALDRLVEVGGEIWAQAPAKHGFGRAGLWRLDQHSWLDRVARLLEAEALALPPEVDRIAGAELTVDLDLPLDPPLHIRSQIDRLDAGPDLAVVVDYKTGRAIDRKAVEEGRYLQLQLYAHLARQQTGADRVIARYAFLRPPAKPWELDTAREADAALVADAVAIAAEVRADVEAGRFRVAPSDGCPRWCAFQHICRRHEAPALKTWG